MCCAPPPFHAALPIDKSAKNLKFFVFFCSGHNLHRVSFFAARGLDDSAVASLSTPFAVGLIAGNIGLGLWIDGMRVRQRTKLLRWAYLGFLAVLCWACLPDGYLGSEQAAAVWMACYGLSSGMVGIIRSVIIPDIFGRNVLGRVNALIMGLGVAASGLGPLVFGVCEALTGSYRYAMIGLAVPLVVGVAALGAVGAPMPPRRRIPPFFCFFFH